MAYPKQQDSHWWEQNGTVPKKKITVKFFFISLLVIGSLLFLGYITRGYAGLQVSRPLLFLLSLAACLFLGVIWFERQKYGATTLVLLALLTAIAGLGRVPFAAIPSVQPTSFVVILCGLVFGGRFGFMVGVGAAFWSNLFLGHGPWSLWQMAAWGLMGATSGMGRHFLSAHKGWLLLFGFLWGILFGVGMNIWYVAGFLPEFSWGAVITACATSIYFDIAHGMANVFFLWWQKDRWYRLLERARNQYEI